MMNSSTTTPIVGFVVDRLIESGQQRCMVGETIKCSIENISGHGYLSHNNRITFAGDELFSVIFKVPTVSIVRALVDGDVGVITSFLPVLIGFHNQEVKFYEQIASQYPRPFIPQLYAAKGCCNDKEDESSLKGAFLLMEDVQQGGGVHADIRKGLTVGQVESALKTIAHFHAFSLTIPIKTIEAMRLERPYKLLAGETNQLIDRLLAFPGGYFAAHESALRKFIGENADAIYYECHQHFGIRPVLSHGDFWANNLLFNAEGKVKSLLDWQCTHPNTGLNDVSHFLVSAVSGDVRLEKQHEWLHLYHDSFSATLKQLGVTDNPYTDFEFVEQIYKYHFPAQLMYAIQLMSILLEKEKDEAVIANLIQRMVAGFEEIREMYE